MELFADEWSGSWTAAERLRSHFALTISNTFSAYSHCLIEEESPCHQLLIKWDVSGSINEFIEANLGSEERFPHE